MNVSKKPYKGCRDFFPHDKRKLEYIFQKTRQVCESFGYEPYDGPLLESIDLYYAKSGQEIVDEQLYSFTDRGERKVAIRPEMTPTLARMVAQIHREVAKPIRWYSLPNLMRYEKPQKGRLREHWQLNCDIFGAPAAFGEFEILQMLITLLTSFGANSSQFKILINDRRIVDALFNDILKLEKESSYKLYKIIDKSKKVSEQALLKMLNESFSDSQISIIQNYLKINSLAELKVFAQEHKIEDCLTDLTTLFEQLEDIEFIQYLCYDPAIVRGLDYYTGIVFEAFDLHPDNKRAICGGGSYANLLQIFNETPLPGIGFGLGDVTLTDFLDTHQLLPDLSKPPTNLLICYQDESVYSYALKVNHQMRSLHSCNIEFHPIAVKPKKVFQLAQKKGIDHVLFLGSNEMNNKMVSFKNLKTKESLEVEFSNLQDLRI